MKKYEYNIYSQCLNRTLNVKVYGHYGQPMLFFPCQNSKSNDLENFQMIDNLADYIENGQIKIFSVDTIDSETYSDEFGDKGHRAYLIEQYFYFVVNELLPVIYEDCGGFIQPIVSGFSMGANHSTIMFLRRPDLFAGLMAFSGCYDNNMFFGDWCDEKLYNNSPLRFIPNLAYDHPHIAEYNKKFIYFCCGQGNWEEEAVRTLRIMQNNFYQKGINGTFDYWGFDVAHDWCWWKLQIRNVLPKALY